MEMPWTGIPSPDGSSSGTELEPTLNADSAKFISTFDVQQKIFCTEYAVDTKKTFL